MASPSIALRFRDAIPGVDTIAEHGAVLSREGAVWWGWWKKEFEEIPTSFFEKLNANKPVDLLILDRSTRRMFYATCTKWVINQPEAIDAIRVPEYYRDFIGNISVWFLLRSIEQSDFSEKVSGALGEKTLLPLEELADRAHEMQSSVTPINGSCLVHLSDLHFGADYGFARRGHSKEIGDQREYLTDCLMKDLDRLKLTREIGAVLVTGDFTTRGDWSDQTRDEILGEFKALRAALKLDKDRILAVPGNHDVERYPPGTSVTPAVIATGTQTTYKHEREFRLFVDELAGRNWRESLNYVRRLRFPNADLLVCILNSCAVAATQWTEYGYVGTSGVDALRKLGAENIARPTYKFMALHHHLLPVAQVEAPQSKGVTLSLDAAELLDEAQSVGVHVALHGHQHLSRLVYYKTIPFMRHPRGSGLHIVSNGSASVCGDRRVGDERNSYCLFRIERDHLHLWMRELRKNGDEGATLFDGRLDLVPAAAS